MQRTRELRLLASAVLLLLTVAESVAKYEPAGCSDEGCGIPCYMRPVEDPCHYQPHSPCDDSGSTDLEQFILNLNSSLHRLENKLIQKGVIPAGDTCTPLKTIDHGGVIYSDLLLSPGVVAYYVCQDGYSLAGYPNRTCATDGTWTDGERNDPVCEDTVIECVPLLNIPYGHVHYSTVDTTKILPGDVVTYSCDPPYLLDGTEYRICMSNGTWSEEEPQCSEPPSSSGRNTTQEKSDRSAVIAGTVIGILLGVTCTIVVVIAVIALIRKCHPRTKGYEDLSEGENNTLQSSIKDREESVKAKKGKVLSISPQHDQAETIMAEQ